MGKLKVYEKEFEVKVATFWKPNNGGTVNVVLQIGKACYTRHRQGVSIQKAEAVGEVLEAQLKDRYL